MLLFYLRHGDPIYDPDSLTPLGSRQAEALGKRLSLYGVDEIYASTSRRAMLTAAPACEMMKKEMTLLDWCNEMHAWVELTRTYEDGRSTWCFYDPEIRETFCREEIRVLGRKWYAHPELAPYGFEKGITRIQRETDAFMAQFGYEHDLEKNMYFSRGINTKRVALFAHQGFGLAFLSCLTDVPYPQFCTHFDMGHTGMTVIHFPEKEGWVIPQILQLSSDSHLYREGLPTCYQNQIRF